ncbi:hypothetical protein [Rhizobium sp. RU36D]|uniref:SGNH/GDSL hydrolase family protein n=1 Tax=Rhizobium sp. RU36D TaxID=1907415 RepID=UPI0009D885E7|nr:hypothetical protein [Rhizobium sp. RU36D]SMD21150.1 hypothetical protein SAMN05880593_1662 [Rhizobium sp. RU36D]
MTTANGILDNSALADILAGDDNAPFRRRTRGPGAAYGLMQKLRLGRPCIVVVNGDSTSTLAGGTATSNSSWLYRLFADHIAPLFPEVSFVMYSSFNTGTGAYDVTTTIQTGSGANTCSIYNASIGGSIPTFLYGGNYFFEAYKPSAISADLIIYNHGFNIQTGAGDRFSLATYMLGALDELHALHPEAGIIVVAQNPRSSDTASSTQLYRAQQLVAQWKNADLLHAYDVFWDAGRPAGWYYDATHPSADQGSPAIAEAAFDLCLNVGSQRNSVAPTIVRRSGENILSNGKFDTFSGGAATGWTATNCTLTEDTSDFETGSRALVMTCSSDAAAYIEQTITGNPLKALSGKFVTVAARFRIRTSSHNNAGIIGINRSGATEQRSARLAGTDGRGKYVWRCVGINLPKITDTGVGVVVRLYAAEAAGIGVSANGAAVAVDRVVMVPGYQPFDTV